jgi:hypothetical protein
LAALLEPCRWREYLRMRRARQDGTGHRAGQIDGALSLLQVVAEIVNDERDAWGLFGMYGADSEL